MVTQMSANFEVTGWDESARDDADSVPKCTSATVTKTFHGDIEGTADLEYLMAYAADGTATFVGLERIQARVAGRTGGFVLQHVGRYADGAATGDLTVAAGSGTGDLAGLTGTGTFVADPSGSVELSLTFG